MAGLAAEAPADTGTDQNEDNNHSHYEPKPDVGATLTNDAKSSFDTATVGHILHTVGIHQADLSPDGSKEVCNPFFGFLNSSIDVIISGERLSGDSFSRDQSSQDQNSDDLHCQIL